MAGPGAPFRDDDSVNLLKMKLLASVIGVAVATASLVAQSSPLRPLLVVRLADPGGGVTAPSGTSDAGARVTEAGSGPQEEEAPRHLTPLSVTRLDAAGASATLDSTRPFSMRFTQPLPIRDVLLLLVRDTGLSLVTEPGIEGVFTGELHGVTLRQALDLVLPPHGLEYTVDGTAIRVVRRRAVTRIFDVNIAAAQRRGSGRAALPAGSDLPAAGAAPAGVEWKADADAFADIAEGIRTLLSPGGRVAIDRKAGVVQVTDETDRLDRVAVYIESVERRLRRQVEIDAKVIEVSLTGSAAAVNWSSAIERARGTASGAALDMAVFLQALGEQGTVAVLANPRVTALHNEPALMRVGLRGVTFERHDKPEREAPSAEGFALAVVPHIAADGVIMMTVSPSVTHGAGSADEVSTAVRLRDGETLVLPGLRRREGERGVQAGGGFTALFKREQPRKISSEIAVLLTPKVM